MQRLLLASFATFFLRTLALRSLRTCAAIRLTTRSFVLRSLGAGAAIRLATLCLGARGVLRCFASLTRPLLRHALLRRLRSAFVRLSALIHRLWSLLALRRARSFGLRPTFTRLRRIFLWPHAFLGLRLARLRTLRFLARALLGLRLLRFFV